MNQADKEDDSQIIYQGDEQSPNSKVILIAYRFKMGKLKSQRKGKVTINNKTENNKGTSKAKGKDLKEFEELDAVLKKGRKFQDYFNFEEYEQLQVDLRAYGVVKKNMKDEKGLTIPKPFKFNDKDSQNKASIRQQKVEKMVEEKRKEEEDALNFQFRANPLPASVKIPMYEFFSSLKIYDSLSNDFSKPLKIKIHSNRYGSLLKAQEEKRMEVTEKSKQITLANQKPFSFYERDLNKQKSLPKEESFRQFKANPIPQ